eukprot:746490-Hanusia_phi.AAC.1
MTEVVRGRGRGRDKAQPVVQQAQKDFVRVSVGSTETRDSSSLILSQPIDTAVRQVRAGERRSRDGRSSYLRLQSRGDYLREEEKNKRKVLKPFLLLLLRSSVRSKWVAAWLNVQGQTVQVLSQQPRQETLPAECLADPPAASCKPTPRSYSRRLVGGGRRGSRKTRGKGGRGMRSKVILMSMSSQQHTEQLFGQPGQARAISLPAAEPGNEAERGGSGGQCGEEQGGEAGKRVRTGREEWPGEAARSGSGPRGGGGRGGGVVCVCGGHDEVRFALQDQLKTFREALREKV